MNKFENLNKTERKDNKPRKKKKDNKPRKKKKNKLRITKIMKISKRKLTTNVIHPKTKKAHTKIGSRKKN